jgi:hypothetical protein
MTDPNSGLPYYYNEAENTTTWDTPDRTQKGDEKKEELAIPNLSLGDHVSKIGNPIGEMVENAEETNRVVPEVEVSSLPLNNQKVQIETFQKKVEDGTSVVDEPVQSYLPEGWVEMIDPTSSLPYYYNEAENITAWDRPTLSMQNVVNEELNANDASNNGDDVFDAEETDYLAPDVTPEETEEDMVETFDQAKLDLPHGWVEMTDPSSGLPYYFNEAENITTWDKPDLSEKNNVNEEANRIPDVFDMSIKESGVDDTQETHTQEPHTQEPHNVAPDVTPEETEEDEAGIEDSAESDLPEGWVEMTDPSSGLPYYYNEAESITTWDTPCEPKKIVHDESEIQESKSANNEFEEDSSFHYNESSKQWELKEQGSGHIASAKISSGKVSDGISDEISGAPGLPDGWVECVDENSGMSYYFHERDNVTTWDRPSGTTVQSDMFQKPSFSARHRPAHCLATFGFGGRLCVMVPQVADRLSSTTEQSSTTLRKGPVVLHRISSFVRNDYLPVLENTGLKGPVPLNGLTDSEVLSHLEEKSGDRKTDPQLLWSLLSVAATWKGRLRSADGFSDPNGPEAAIVNLLLGEDSNESFKTLPKLSGKSIHVKRTLQLECTFFLIKYLISKMIY